MSTFNTWTKTGKEGKKIDTLPVYSSVSLTRNEEKQETFNHDTDPFTEYVATYFGNKQIASVWIVGSLMTLFVLLVSETEIP